MFLKVREFHISLVLTTLMYIISITSITFIKVRI